MNEEEIRKEWTEFTKKDSSWIGASGYMLDEDLIESFWLSKLSQAYEKGKKEGEKKDESNKKTKYLGQWHAGHIALFGAILMSKGICGKEKEELKALMYQALTTVDCYLKH